MAGRTMGASLGRAPETDILTVGHAGSGGSSVSLMKILLVNDYGTATGGAEFQVLTLRDGLRRRGHDARLFSSSAKLVASDVLADYLCPGTTSRIQTLSQTVNPGAYWQLRRVLQAFQPDVVHVSMFMWQLSPLILLLLKDVPSLYHVVTYKPVCPLGTKMLPDGSSCRHTAGAACRRNRCLPLHAWLPLMLQMRLWQRWCRAFNIIVANSSSLQRQLVAAGIDVAEVVRGGVPPGEPRPPLTSPPTVAFAGRLVPEKGADVLVRAFAKVAVEVPEARLILVGEGEDRGRISGLIGSLGLGSAVSLTGHLPRREMERQFSQAWVQAVPSRWAEPFGLVAVDAMMRGTAVVASACGGLTETVRDGENGFLVPPGCVDSLARGLSDLLQDRELAERMGRAGRQIGLMHFTDTFFVSQFVRLYRTSIACKGRTRGS